MKTVKELKEIIKKGFEINDNEKLVDYILYIESLVETYAHEMVLDGKLMEDLIMKQIDLETEVA